MSRSHGPTYHMRVVNIALNTLTINPMMSQTRNVNKHGGAVNGIPEINMQLN